jgi:hypothetical protein
MPCVTLFKLFKLSSAGPGAGGPRLRTLLSLTVISKTGAKMFALLWDDADQYLGFVGVPKPPVAY